MCVWIVCYAVVHTCYQCIQPSHTGIWCSCEVTQFSISSAGTFQNSPEILFDGGWPCNASVLLRYLSEGKTLVITGVNM